MMSGVSGTKSAAVRFRTDITTASHQCQTAIRRHGRLRFLCRHLQRVNAGSSLTPVVAMVILHGPKIAGGTIVPDTPPSCPALQGVSTKPVAAAAI